DPGVADLLLRPHQALRHGFLAHQEGTRHGRSRKAADGTERQRHLRLRAERGMATGEDQPQHVVAESVVALFDRRHLRRDSRLRLELAAFLALQDLAAQPVDRLMATDVDEPGAGVRGNAARGPLLDRRRDGVLQAFLGKLEIADEADQRREDATRPVPERRVDGARGYARFACHGTSSEKTRIGRTSMEPNRAEGTRSAIVMAWSRSLASIR